MADCLRVLHRTTAAHAKLGDDYREVVDKYVVQVAENIRLLDENTKLKQIMAAAPALTAAAEMSIEQVGRVEQAWLRPESGGVQ